MITTHVCSCGATTTRKGRCEHCNLTSSRGRNRGKNQRVNATGVYQTERWAQLRARVLRRDNNTCHCGAHATTVGHITPFRGSDDPNAWNPSNLRAECLRCNGKEAGRRSHRDRPTPPHLHVH